MKRQSSISAYFTKPSAKKRPRLDQEQKENEKKVKQIDKPTEINQAPHRSTPDLAQLHSQFRQKLGDLAKAKSLKRQQAERFMNHQEALPKQKLTPLETQVIELKAKYPDCLLLIEVGYKYRFFGEDAKIASRVLHIANFVDRNFYVASIPVFRLNVHIKKLVNAGYKVGVVRQTETAALKAAGSNKSQPFTRELDQLITKGTMVDDLITNDASNAHTVGGGHLMCLIEQKRGGHGPDERVLIGMIAVQTSTGDIIYDTFEDTYMRTELETRLLHIEPNEILIPTLISQPTERLIQHLSLQTSHESVRIERISANDNLSTDYNAALTFVSDFYATTAYLSHIVELPDNVIKALACLLRYLQEFNLSNILTSAKFFSHFVSQSHMLLSGNTLVNLEVYRNNTDFTEKGSLFSILNHTQTKFGHRLLRKWVGRPLVDINQLNQRTFAIEELLKTTNRKKSILSSVLRQLPDLEKGLCRIHYGKSMPLELIHVLDGFLKVSSSFHESHNVFESSLLNQLFSPFPTIRQAILDFRSSVQPTKDKIDYFVSEEQWPDIPREKKNIQYVECLLQQHLEELKEVTGLGKDLTFVTVAGVEYLLEVSNTKTKKIPQTWIKVSGTKAVSRYHDKYIIEQLKERERHRELLNMSVERAYKGFLAAIAEKYEELRDVVSCLAQLDCLLSLSITASQLNYTKPVFVDTDQPYMDVIQARHPIIEQLSATSTYVPNDIQLANPHKVMILTGPNMGGKSSYIRQIALIAMMAQIGSYVPAKKATLGILDAIYTRMGASDNMMRGKSTFMVELHETSDMMRQATSRSLVILDELGRGTSTHDGQAIAYAALKHFIEHVQCITLFVTHYPSLGQITHVFPNQVRNYFMSYLQEEAMDESGIANIVFLYKLMEGVATSSYGMNVARLADIPISIIKAAKEKSDRFEKEMRHVELKQQKLRLLQSIMHETRLSLDNKQRLKSLQ